jgi:chemotaxis protein methyltransferase CheR
MHVSHQEFREIQTLVRELCGLVLSDDKTYLVRTRLEPVVQSHGCNGFSDYLGRVKQFDARLMRDELVEALTTGETSFNRDGHPFQEFRDRILPALAATFAAQRESGVSRPVARLWSAGCSTGQEPYSLAIAIHEFVAANSAAQIEQFPILATDVCNASLRRASEGRFTQREVDRGLAPEICRRYFRPENEVWTANDALRKSIDFSRLNLIDRLPSLGPFAVIFCRNVLIYFDLPTRNRLCDQFHDLLQPSGLLVVGAAENLIGVSTAFVSERVGATTVYRKAAS